SVRKRLPCHRPSTVTQKNLSFFKLSRISCILSAPDTSHPYMAFTCYKDEEVHKCDVKTIKEKLHAQ
ncbi:hypothetical protein, partial [Escherichia coli]|uniref:hypothetical protein n=1 Tax=Escherichia coli TaxID=562 RepID=UPI0020329128